MSGRQNSDRLQRTAGRTTGHSPMDRSLRPDHPEFVPWDIEVARLNFGANCGPSAFAAATGREVCRIMRYFAHFEQSQCWTNLTHMRRAFEQAGYHTEVFRLEMPVVGVALIQWTGPWTQKHFFSRWSLVHTHWVAISGDWVFDHTVGEWQSLLRWSRETAPEFLAEIPQASGWSVKYGLEVKSSSNWLESTPCPIGSLSCPARSLSS